MVQTIDQILLGWLEAHPRLPRRDRQALILRELVSLQVMRAVCCDDGGVLASRVAESEAVCAEKDVTVCGDITERVTKLSVALRASLLDGWDTATARRIAETLSVSTDGVFLHDTLDTDCCMTLRVGGDGPRRPAQLLRGADIIIIELSEFQESVLLLQMDFASPGKARDNDSALPYSVGGVSPVKSWVQSCEVELEVGTQMTYYADGDCTRALFDLRSTFLFAVDGTKIERILREILPRGGRSLNDLLSVIHFGAFKAE